MSFQSYTNKPGFTTSSLLKRTYTEGGWCFCRCCGLNEGTTVHTYKENSPRWTACSRASRTQYNHDPTKPMTAEVPYKGGPIGEEKDLVKVGLQAAESLGGQKSCRCFSPSLPQTTVMPTVTVECCRLSMGNKWGVDFSCPAMWSTIVKSISEY